MAKETLSAETLHSLLEKEFRRAQLVECVSQCRIPTPIFGEPLSPNDTNWHVQIPWTCPRQCHRVIKAVVERLSAQYDIELPAGTGGSKLTVES